ncbi:glycosyltransferase family 2 protein [Rhodococcus sp. ARC_M6]|uniref:glycosyltransferase n=1 Tax=Rhodococcus sp. ARC_M6 TaxID=2928852 RepID=UPI001FB4A75D|nr:glycosyltransferase [Rhodococcus sp. ARC_M6]MCJ0903975.1 glycosyltransferase [Rhodococcus sp. ARC_M6]
MKPTLVSVVIPAYNAMEHIDEQLTALASQDYDGEFEVIVSDNRSTDGLAQFIANHPATDALSLQVVNASEARGGGYARNVGVAASRGDFIAFCDADDRVHPSWLTAITRAAENSDAVGGVVETTSINSAEVATWRTFTTETQFGSNDFLPYGITCTFGIWRAAFDVIDGFDLRYVNSGEDIDLSWRLQLAGMTLAHAPDAVVAYRLRSTYRGTWNQTRAYGIATAQLYSRFRDHGQKRTAPRELALTVLALLIFNPLIPQRICPMPRGRWFVHAGNLVGKIQGSVKHRVLYI